ncbi:MAG: hypothetical protein DHS20C05_13280 [Hyphococcus sp.]|nr:MAG: hypothetical protein DHS20C05_13280 [Marinicaulis sp.]
MDLSDQIALLLGDFSHLESRIRHLDYDTDKCGERINVRCSYLAFRDDKPTFDEFIDVISNHLTSFCLPRSEIKAAQQSIQGGDHVQAALTMDTLSQRARDLFIKAKKGSNRSGEGGEIVLYLLNEWQLKAPQIVSKMYLKTNNNMPVHGTDGIHARYDSGLDKLFLYWGESKAHKTLEGGLSDALASIKKFIDEAKEKREIEIVSSFADFDGLDDDAQEAFLKYLDPYEEASNERVTVYSCLLVHNAPQFDNDASEDYEKLYIEEVNKTVEAFISSINQKVKGKALEQQRFEFFLLPVPDVQDFRDKFQAKIGWPND